MFDAGGSSAAGVSSDTFLVLALGVGVGCSMLLYSTKMNPPQYSSARLVLFLCRSSFLHLHLSCRRELREASGRATAAESALQQQAASFEARLAKLQQWYNRQAAVVAQLRRGKAPKYGQVGFTNTNK